MIVVAVVTVRCFLAIATALEQPALQNLQGNPCVALRQGFAVQLIKQ